ncbi:plasmid stabilization system protein ParE [Mesorhizobium jarvisii]
MAEAELGQLYDDIAERASPAIAWNFVVGIRDHCLGLSTFPQRGAERVEIMPGLRIVGIGAPSASLSRSRANGC